jgi:hypothetical protein
MPSVDSRHCFLFCRVQYSFIIDGNRDLVIFNMDPPAIYSYLSLNRDVIIVWQLVANSSLELIVKTMEARSKPAGIVWLYCSPGVPFPHACSLPPSWRAAACSIQKVVEKLFWCWRRVWCYAIAQQYGVALLLLCIICFEYYKSN